MMTVGAARKRINAIKQYSSLGAGFRIAMRDLEIRGAGSILGTAQSGHIMAVGFDLYCQLLKQAVAQLKGEKVESARRSRCSSRFCRDERSRVRPARSRGARAGLHPDQLCHRSHACASRLTGTSPKSRRANSSIACAKIGATAYGKFPLAVDNLLLLTEIKLAAAKAGVTRVEVREGKLMLTRRGDFLLVGGKFPRIGTDRIDRQLAEVLELIRKI